jgi:hypothetical protein
MTVDQFPKMLHLIDKDSEEFKPEMLNKKNPAEDFKILKDYLAENFNVEERKKLKNSKYFYEIIFEKPGELVMPILVDYIFEDGSRESHNFPAEIWRYNDNEVQKIVASEKKIVKIIIDPKEITADVNLNNNQWPKKEKPDRFEKFKNSSK